MVRWVNWPGPLKPILEPASTYEKKKKVLEELQDNFPVIVNIFSPIGIGGNVWHLERPRIYFTFTIKLFF